MAVSKAQQKAQNKWIAKAYDRVNLTLPKGQKDVVQAHATARNESVNGFIGRAIAETMARDNAYGPQEAVGQPVGAGGVVSFLPSDTLEAAQRAAEAAGEAVEDFLARAVEAQAQRDRRMRGGNPNE